MLPPILTAGLRQLRAQKVVLVIGAGCSVEFPTSLDTASAISIAAHDELVACGAIVAVEESWDLAKVADALESSQSSRQMLYDQLPIKKFRLAQPNDGYLIAAALQAEGVVKSVLSLNYDLAGVAALNRLGISAVDEIYSSADVTTLSAQVFAFLNGSAISNGNDFVITTSDLEDSWQGGWQQLLTEHHMASPIVVFAGLGSNAPLLEAAVQRIETAIGPTDATYLVDPGEIAANAFARDLRIDESKYFQQTWNAFMLECAGITLSAQLESSERQLPQLKGRRPDMTPDLTLSGVFAQLSALGLVKYGLVRSRWFGDRDSESYDPYPEVGTTDHFRLLDLLAVVAAIMSHAESVALGEDGHLSAAISSGGKRKLTLFSSAAMSFDVAVTRLKHSRSDGDADVHIIAHTDPPASTAPPEDLIDGEEEGNSILNGPRPRFVYLPSIVGDEGWADLLT